jgi:hypothetical protein
VVFPTCWVGHPPWTVPLPFLVAPSVPCPKQCRRSGTMQSNFCASDVGKKPQALALPFPVLLTPPYPHSSPALASCLLISCPSILSQWLLGQLSPWFGAQARVSPSLSVSLVLIKLKDWTCLLHPLTPPWSFTCLVGSVPSWKKVTGTGNWERHRATLKWPRGRIWVRGCLDQVSVMSTLPLSLPQETVICWWVKWKRTWVLSFLKKASWFSTGPTRTRSSTT